MTTTSNNTDVSVSMVTQVNEETKALIDKMPYREMVTRWITITGGEDKFDRNMETTFYFHEVMIHKGAGKTAGEAAKLAWESLLEEYEAAEGEEAEQAPRIAAEARADEEFKTLTEWDYLKTFKFNPKVCEQTGEYKDSGSYVINHITNKVIQLLEAGEIPWRKPWTINGVMPTNLVTKKEYRGANAFFLSMYNREFASPYFLSFKQAKDLGGSVRAGSKSIPVVFWKWVKDDLDDDDEDARPIVRYYSVFNAEQCDGIANKIPQSPSQTWDNTPIERGEEMLRNMRDKPTIKFGNLACYSPSSDTVTVPELKYYENPAEYYSTLFHEVTHSTGHKNRLNRLTENAAFGTAVYSKEELIAEMGAAYLCGICDIMNDKSIYNTAGYIQGWLKKLRDDKRMIIYAAAAAQKAVDFIQNKT